MKKDFLNKIKKALEEKRDKIKKELETFAQKDEKNKHNWKSKFPKLGEESGDSVLEVGADEVEEYVNKLPVEYSLELKLKSINTALQKIKTGKYGICEKCGKKISLKRLTTLNEAKYCVNCAKKTKED